MYGTFQVLATDTVGTTIAVTGVGGTPKALFVWGVGRGDLVDALTRRTTRNSIAYVAGPTDRRCLAGHSRDAVGTMDTHDSMRDDLIGGIIADGAGNVYEGQIDLQSFDGDGFTAIVDVQFARDTTFSFLALISDEITNVTTGNFTNQNALGTQAITGVGFQPDWVGFGSHHSKTFPSPPFQDHQNAIGAMVSSTEQGWIGWSSADGVATSSADRATQQGLEAFGAVQKAGSNVDMRFRFDSFDADGYTIDHLEADDDEQMFMAIKGGNFAIGEFDTKTDGTDIVVTGLGFAPSDVLFLSSMDVEPAQDTTQADAGMSIGGFSGPSDQGAQHFIDRDGLGTSEVRVGIEFDDVYLRSTTAPAIDATMRGKTLDSDGFTAFMSNPETSAAHMMFWAFGPAAPDQTIVMDELTLASSPEALTPVGGAVTVPMNELTLAGSPEALTAVPGGVIIPMDELSLVSSPEALAVVPGAITIAMDELTLLSVADNVGVVPGGIAIGMQELLLVGSAEAFNLAADRFIDMDSLTLVGSAEALTPVGGAVTVAMDELTLVGSAETMIPSKVVIMAETVLASSPEALAVVPGAIAIPMDELTLSASPEILSPLGGPVTVVMDELILTGSAEFLGDVGLLVKVVKVVNLKGEFIGSINLEGDVT